MAIVGCLERALLRSNRRIDARAATIFRSLRAQRARKAFVDGERAWLRYRRRTCSAQASVYHGGSAQPIAYLQCQLDRNQRPLSDLTDMERATARR